MSEILLTANGSDEGQDEEWFGVAGRGVGEGGGKGMMDALLWVLLYSVMLVGYVYTATFVLAVAGLVGCAGRFDYNLLLALGWIFLADKHPAFSSSFAVSHPLMQFYVLVLGSALIDSITIYSSSSQPDKFTFLFMPLLEIGLKLAIIAASVYYDRKRSSEG